MQFAQKGLNTFVNQIKNAWWRGKGVVHHGRGPANLRVQRLRFLVSTKGSFSFSDFQFFIFIEHDMAENRLEMWHMVSQGVRLSDFTPCLVHVSSHSSFAFYERKTNLCQALSR